MVYLVQNCNPFVFIIRCFFYVHGFLLQDICKLCMHVYNVPVHCIYKKASKKKNFSQVLDKNMGLLSDFQLFLKIVLASHLNCFLWLQLILKLFPCLSANLQVAVIGECHMSVLREYFNETCC